MRLRDLRSDTRIYDPIDLPDDKAMEHLLAGEMVLFERQVAPPIAIVFRLQDMMNGLDAFGPEPQDRATYAKVTEAVCRNGVRQHMVEGQAVPWFQHQCKFKSEVTERLLNRSGIETKLFEMLNTCWKTYLEKDAGIVERSRELVTSEMISQRIIGETSKRNRTLLRRQPEYWMASPEWYAFYERWQVLQSALEERKWAGLTQTRILCCETTPQGDRLLPPVEVSAGFGSKRRKTIAYCFTSDLPGSWFVSERQLHVRRSQATKWMAETLGHFADQGRQATSQDLKLVAQERFCLSENAARQAWRNVDKSPYMPLHNPRKDKRVKLQEIRGLK